MMAFYYYQGFSRSRDVKAWFLSTNALLSGGLFNMSVSFFLKIRDSKAIGVRKRKKTIDSNTLALNQPTAWLNFSHPQTMESLIAWLIRLNVATINAKKYRYFSIDEKTKASKINPVTITRIV